MSCSPHPGEVPASEGEAATGAQPPASNSTRLAAAGRGPPTPRDAQRSQRLPRAPNHTLLCCMWLELLSFSGTPNFGARHTKEHPFPRDRTERRDL